MDSTTMNITTAVSDSRPGSSRPVVGEVAAQAAVVHPVASGGDSDPLLSMLERAARDPAVDIEKFERLMAMRERLEDRRAKQSFDAAISVAKGEIGPIAKNREVDFTNKAGQRTNYRHEDFAAVASAVDPVLSRHGLSYRFRSDQQGARLRVTCRLAHADGYAEETSLEAQNDETGNKNAIQSVGSAATYLQRYTLKLALGIAASNDDDARSTNGNGASHDDPTIDADQVAHLHQLMRDTNVALPIFLKTMGVKDADTMAEDERAEAMTRLSISRYKDALARFAQRKREMSKGAAK